MASANDPDDAIEGRIALTELKVGDVLTAEAVAELSALVDNLAAATRRYGEAYDQGLQDGRQAAGGAEVAAVLQRIDELEAALAVERGLNHVLRKIDMGPGSGSPRVHSV